MPLGERYKSPACKAKRKKLGITPERNKLLNNVFKMMGGALTSDGSVQVCKMLFFLTCKAL